MNDSSPRPQRSGAARVRGSASNRNGLAPRACALFIVSSVVNDQRTLDHVIAEPSTFKGLKPQDRGLARMVATTALRRSGQLERILNECLRQPLKGRAKTIYPLLLVGMAQLLFMDVPAYAAVDTTVRLANSNRERRAYAKLVNGVLRRVEREKQDLLALTSPMDNLPGWLQGRWEQHYGPEKTKVIADCLAVEPSFDVSLKSGEDLNAWAERLEARILPNGSLRRLGGGDVTSWSGFKDGQWWVQDAAARLPVQLLGPLEGKTVADLCAAPGGKTAHLAAHGARVFACDQSGQRMKRLKENMSRLGVKVIPAIDDARLWRPPTACDAVLLDAPCSATGTIRRHPDFRFLKTERSVLNLVEAQAALIDNAIKMLKTDGVLIYCTCSLEREEGEAQVEAALSRHSGLKVVPVAASEAPGFEDMIQGDGTLRILPTALPDPDPRWAGATGFYIARLSYS